MSNNEEIKFFDGTQRIMSPLETIENNEEKLNTAGITRVTEITHLDRIKIPVFSAIRPTSEEGSVSVYSGKGIGVSQAKASAMMEGFERYSAERKENDEVILATIDEISNEGDYIHPEELILPNNFKKDSLDLMTFEWSVAYDLIDDKKYYIPSNAIYHPYVPQNIAQALFKGNTNGLASGNSLNEAILHGIFEVVERDAWSIFELTKKNCVQIETESIESKNIKEILSKFKDANINIKLMNLTADINIPTIAASSDDVLLKDPGLLTLGVGTHLNPEIAVLRSLTEVAQSRATQIQGSREDTVRADFMRKAGYERMKRINSHYFKDEDKKIKLSEIQNNSSNSIKENIKNSVSELEKVGVEHVLYSDLTRPELDIPVVRIIIPSLELYSIDNSRAGERFLNI